jgi:hypothetical protein
MLLFQLLLLQQQLVEAKQGAANQSKVAHSTVSEQEFLNV